MRNTLARLSFLTTLFLLMAEPLLAQSVPQLSVNEIVNQAQKQAKTYVEIFKNLLSEETKTFEIYDKKSEVKKRRVVVSTFIVYQLSRDESRVTEYRNVLSVDGKKVDNIDQRAQEFFEKLVKTESSAKEFDKLQDESLRYDDNILIIGMTLSQAPVLNEKLRPYFDFKLIDREIYGGSETFLISYEQIRPSPDIVVNGKGGQGSAKPVIDYDVDADADPPLNERILGKFWIDANTFQIKREQRQFTIQPARLEKPLTIISDEFEYQASAFGILTPKRIVHMQYRVRTKVPTAIKEARIILEYDKFTKPDVEIKSAEVK